MVCNVLKQQFIRVVPFQFFNKNSVLQIARELRLRDIGGIIVVDFIDMTDEGNSFRCTFKIF